MRADYDVIIAGGGMAGLISAAAVSTYSKQKARVLVVDRNPQSEAGKKTANGWTCGDAVSKNSVDYLAKNIGIKYGKPELEHEVKGVYVYSPDHQTKVLFEGAGYTLNRKILPQRQVNDAKKLGVNFQFNVALEALLHEDSYVTGVQGRNLLDGSTFKKTARIVIDATGSASKLRANLPIKSFIQKEIDKDDMEATGRYIYNFEMGKEDKTYFDPEYCIIHLDQYLAPGGYAWTFPKGPQKVNIGLGVQKKALEDRNKRYNKNDNLQSLIDEYVKSNVAIKEPKLADMQEDDGNAKGSWQVPVRRQNDCMVANGYAVVGDAAWMPRPIDAGGIGPSIYGSVILGRIVATALEANDISESGLWQYNIDYMNYYGYQMASFEVLRRYLQTITNEQISYGMKHFLSEDDIQHIVKREHPKFNRVALLNPMMWLRILGNLDLARGLRFTATKSEELIQHNLNYPKSPKGFLQWQGGLHALLQEAYSRF